MNYQTISDMYAAEAKRSAKKLKAIIAGLTDEELHALPEGEKWSVTQIVEHISMVDEGAGKLCSRLLRKAQAAGGAYADGTARISPAFIEKAMASAQSKLEAPETVQPRTGRSIADSFAAFDHNLGKFGELMPLFESIDDTNHKIPHPYFGDMTATEWFAVEEVA